MAYAYLSNQVETTVQYNANATTSGAGTVAITGFDVAPYEGSLLLTIAARVSGTGATTIAVEHSDALSTGYAAVPAAAIVNSDTGAEATFANIGTAAYAVTRALRRDLLKRYVRVTFTGTDIDQNIVVVFTAQQKYTQP